MKARLLKIHPDLQQAARIGSLLNISRKNLWLFKILLGSAPAQKPPEGIRVENLHIPRQDGRTNIRLRIYKLKSRPALTPVLIWLHGGGYVMGKPENDDRRCVEYVRESGISVVSVDYRCAPKHPFPAGLEDSYAALKWVESHSQQLGVDANRIAVGGASAGGGLAAATTQLAHDRQEIRLALQLLIYPMLDDRTTHRADSSDQKNILWSQESNRLGWESYLGKEYGVEDVPGYAVPARRADLSGMPPAWIGVGTEDLFHDEDVAYAQKLKASGVECELYAVPGGFHGFDVLAPQAQIVHDFQKAQFAALIKHLFDFSFR